MFGSILKNLRLQKGLSQEDIAEELHVVRQTVSKWENELSSPSVNLLIHLSALFGEPIELLLEINDEFTSNHHVVSGLKKSASPSKGKCPTVTKKEEMIATMINRLEGMNEAGVEVLFDLVMLIPDRERWMASTPPERIAELDAIKVQREQEAALEKEKADKEAQQIADAKRNQIYLDHARMFNAIKTIDVPIRYDLSIEEILAIDFVCGGISRCFPEYAYSVAGKYFKYGFVKGVRYVKAQSKKKQREKEAAISAINQ